MSLHIKDIDLTETTTRYLLRNLRIVLSAPDLTEQMAQIILDEGGYFVYHENELLGISPFNSDFEWKPTSFFLAKGTDLKIAPLIYGEGNCIGFIRLEENNYATPY
jgi:hypothetical protein